MEKDRGSRLIAVIALVVGVAGLTLGFAAFSNTLTIKTKASVDLDESLKDENFKIQFSATDTSGSGGEVTTETVQSSTDGEEGATADGTPTINNADEKGPSISDLGAKFTKPGQSVTYTFYVANKGQLPGYLQAISYANAANHSSFAKCTAGAGTTQSYVDTACSHIQVTVSVQDQTTTTTKDDITNAQLAVGAFKPVTVKIEYTEGAVTDGDFTVTFGDITLKYDSVDTNAA